MWSQSDKMTSMFHPGKRTHGFGEHTSVMNSSVVFIELRWGAQGPWRVYRFGLAESFSALQYQQILLLTHEVRMP